MRLYQFFSPDGGLAALRTRRLRISRIDRLNDPFEFLGVLREHANIPNPGHVGIPRYLLILEDIDELVEAIFVAMNLSPSFFTSSLNAKGKAGQLRRVRGRGDHDD